MIRLIVGLKGSGKTTRLIEMVNEAVAAEKGDVICVEKTTKLNNDLDRRVRLIDMDDYEVGNFDGLYGFLTGLYAANYDTTDIFVDQTLKIAGDDLTELAKMIERLDATAAKEGFAITFTISADPSALSAALGKYVILPNSEPYGKTGAALRLRCFSVSISPCEKKRTVLPGRSAFYAVYRCSAGTTSRNTACCRGGIFLSLCSRPKYQLPNCISCSTRSRKAPRGEISVRSPPRKMRIRSDG